jgi:PAS domain S-box-containing protein
MHEQQGQPLSPNVAQIILESISDGVFTVDHEWRITSFNRAAERITGTPRSEAVGRYCWEVFRSSLCGDACPLARTRREGRPLISSSGYIIDRNGRRIPISLSTALLRDEADNLLGCVETFRDLSEVEELRKELQGGFRVGDLVSRSKAMARIFKILPRVAESGSTVLIEGETGTGKELLAKALHHLSPRAEHPFVTVNCGAMPDTLLESELFGYKAGAFTDARRDKPGQFALARGGSIFLDEIGDTSSAFQVRLLRVLQEKRFTPLGGTKQEETDARVIAATHRDLSSMVREGRFREDLFYRINVVRLCLPPLRERKEDIPLLTGHIVEKLNTLHNRAVRGVSREALALLMAHDYPGNVRELENILEHAFVVCPEDVIGPESLPDSFRSPAHGNTGGQLELAVSSVEAQTILEALERSGYNRTRAARELGVHKSTLYRKMHRFGIELPDKKRGGPGHASQ